MCFKLKFVEPVLFLYSLYFYGSMPLVGQLVRHLIEKKRSVELSTAYFENGTDVCPGSHTDSDMKAEIDAEASQILLFMHIAAILPAFLITVLFGGFSDSKGRIPILVLPILGATLRLILLIPTALYGLNISLLILSSFLDGCLGMSSLLFMGCFAYISDVTDFTQRSFRTVLLEAAGGLGVTLSHLLSGYLIDYLGYLWALVVLLGIIFITLIYIVFFLKESFEVRDETVSLCSTKYFKDACKIFFENGDNYKKMDRRLTLLLVFLVSMAQYGSMDVQLLYLLKFPLCLTATWIGFFNALLYIVSNLTNWILIKLLGNLFGDLGLIVLGSIFGITYFLFFANSTNTLMLFLVPLAGCANMLPTPLLRSYGSKIITADKVGLMFASIAWMQMIGILVGGIVQNEIYAATVSKKPQIVFIFDSCLYGCVIITLCVYFCVKKVYSRRSSYEEIIS